MLVFISAINNNPQTHSRVKSKIFECVFSHFCLNEFLITNVLGQKEFILRVFVMIFFSASYQIILPITVYEVTALESLTNTEHVLFL